MADFAGRVEARLTQDDPLFTPIELGDIRCASRVVMAPMTRSRASQGDLVSDLHVEYYGAARGLRASSSPRARSRRSTARVIAARRDLHDAAQVAAWRAVTERVHAARRADRGAADARRAGGEPVQQAGRGAHGGAVGDARRACGCTPTTPGCRTATSPRRWSLTEIPGIVEEYSRAARAGPRGRLRRRGAARRERLPADAVSRLEQQPAARCLRRLPRSTARASRSRCWRRCARRSGRVESGCASAPANPFNDVADPEPELTYGALLDAIAPLRIAYLHVIRSPVRSVDAFAIARRHQCRPDRAQRRISR